MGLWTGAERQICARFSPENCRIAPSSKSPDQGRRPGAQNAAKICGFPAGPAGIEKGVRLSTNPEYEHYEGRSPVGPWPSSVTAIRAGLKGFACGVAPAARHALYLLGVQS